MTVKRSKAAERKLKEIRTVPPIVGVPRREYKGGWDPREIAWDNPYGAWGEKKWWRDHIDDFYNPPRHITNRIKNSIEWQDWVEKGRTRGNWNPDMWWGGNIAKKGIPAKVITQWYTTARQQRGKPLQPLKTKPITPKPFPKKPSVAVSVKKTGPPRPFTDEEMKKARFTVKLPLQSGEEMKKARQKAANIKFEKLLNLKKAYKENNDK